MNRQRGYILILTILVIGALFFFGVLFVGYFGQEKTLAQKGELELIAGQAAKAGIEQGLYELKNDAAWTTGFSKVSLPHSGATYTVTFDNSQTAIPYSTNNTTGSSSATGYNGRNVPAGYIHLVSVGEYGKGKRVEEAMLITQFNPFESAVHVDSNLELKGDVMIDSYNSDNGTYSQTHTNSGGNIGTNSSGSDVVTLNGNVDVYGGVSVGTGGSEDDSVKSTGNANYQSFGVDTPQAIPIITTTPGTNLGPISANGSSVSPAPGTYSSLTVKGNENSKVILSEGTYIITGDLSVGGSGTLELPEGTGRVEIYVLGDISIGGGGIVNETNTPTNFIIYGGENTTSVSIMGGGESYFALYAPNAEVQVGGSGELFGAIVAKEMKLNGSQGAAIHYDQALSKITGGGGTATLKSRWQGNE